jgi:hypothetical protein
MDTLARIAYQEWKKQQLRALRCENLKKAIQVRLARIQSRKVMLKKRADNIRRYHAAQKAQKALDQDTEPEDEIIETDE